MSVSSSISARGKKSAVAFTAAASTSSAASPSPTKRSKSQATTSTAEDDDENDAILEQRRRKAPRTPPKTSLFSKATAWITNDPKIVTPSSTLKVAVATSNIDTTKSNNARRALGIIDEEDVVVIAKKKLPFGSTKSSITIPPNVQSVYSIIQKYTGSIGGNGNGGAIYGELTAGSMQKMINLMIEHTGLSVSSRFIDVGCGLAKPSLHVAQYPGVEFSYGIEREHVRYMLGMSNLEQVLKATMKDEESEMTKTKIGHKCFIEYGDITEAKSFDPFTHVYMFDIGMPPVLFHQMSEMFNKSQAEYLICYHGPKTMIDDYEFNVELLVQTPTYMTASTECHEGYIYRHTGIKPFKPVNTRNNNNNLTFGTPCDPRFSDAWKICRSGLDNLHEYVSDKLQKEWGVSKKRVTRSVARARSNGEAE